MEKCRRILCMLLALCLIAGMVPVSADATEEPELQADTGSVTTEATNSFGYLLNEDIQQEQTEEAASGGYNVLGLTVEGNTAVVEYSSLEEATVVVAVYTEDGQQMLTSGTATVDPETTEATVLLEGELPEYFMAAAYLVDTYDYSPLCQAYSTPMYTRQMQELLASTTDDYDADKVLNFDGDKTTNFAVFAEDTVVIEYIEGVNTVISADDETATYVIGNADSQITGLQEGDVFAYVYGEEQLLIVKVASIEMDGTTATIIGQETEMEEAFSHVKVEQYADAGDMEVDDSTCPDGVVYEGMTADGPSAYAMRAAEGDFGQKHSLNYTFLKEELVKHKDKYFEGDVTLNGTMGVVLDLKFTYYVSLNRQFLEFKTDVGVNATLKLEGAGKVKLPLGDLEFSVFGVNLGFEPELQMETKATVELSFFAGFTVGFSYEGNNGFQNLSGAPKVDADFKIEGTVFFGIDLAPAVNLLGGVIAEGKMEVPIGFELEAKMQGTDFEKPDENTIHECEKCVAMEVKFKGEVSVKLKFVNSKKLELNSKVFYFTVKINDAYWSMDQDECGWGVCPYKGFRVTVHVMDNDWNDAANTEVSAAWSEANKTVNMGVTNENGVLSDFLRGGKYTFIATVDGVELRRTEKITEARQIDMNKAIIDAINAALASGVNPDSVTDSGSPVASGECGANGGNVTWNLYSNGVLRIQGTGAMADYLTDRTPWYDFCLDSEVQVTKAIIADGVTNIGALAFAYCKSMRSITIPNSVTRIEHDAFYYCSSLSEMNIPDSVVEIGEGAFARCASISDFTLPSGVTKIANGLFQDASGLTGITIPSGVTEIEEYAFARCASLTDISIPNTVTAIGRGAFNQCSSLTGIVIPDSVISIGSGAFEQCSSLIGFTIPNGITIIEDGMFSYCRSLVGIVIPEGVTGIGSRAFYECDSLTSVEIPEGVTSIGEYAFSNCESLSNLTIPNTVESIDSYAFEYCANLTEITIPEGVTEIPYRAFYECSKLTDITIPDGVTEIGGYAFYRCTSLEEISLPDTVTTFGTRVFYECSSLSSITIPSGVTSTGTYAFTGCSSLKSVTIPAGIVSIEMHAFADCPSLTDVYYGGTQEQWKKISVYKNNEDLLEATIHFSDDSTATVQNPVLLAAQEEVVTDLTVLEETIQNPAVDAVYGGEYSTEVKENYTQKTASFSGLVPGEEYVLLVLASIETDIVLEPENLLYISQNAAAEDGTLTFTYVQRIDTDTAYVMACGASSKNLQDAVITFPEMKADPEIQTVNPTVTYKGKELTEGLDYVLLGKTDYTEAGTYTCQIRGIRNYTGTVECTYTVTDNVLLGDVTRDGKVTATDYSRLLAHVKKVSLIEDEASLTAADVTGDGKITATDYSRLLAHVKKVTPLW